jgi:hypothetical protein
VFATRVVNVPEPILYSILYPVIGEPPLFDGAFHERLICVPDTAAAFRFVGAPGTPDVEDDVGVADASFDAVPVPTEIMAETR